MKRSVWVGTVALVVAAGCTSAGGTTTAPSASVSAATPAPAVVNCAVPESTTRLALVNAFETTGRTTVTVYDVQDPRTPRSLCTLDDAAGARFISGREISFETRDLPTTRPNRLRRLKLGSAPVETVLTANEIHGHAWSADGSALAFEVEGGLWLKRGNGEPTRLRGPLFAQGTDFAVYAYQVEIRFSPSGRYLFDINVPALTLQVFDVTTGAPIWTAPKGSVFNFAAMAAWRSRGSQLYFRDGSGVRTWDPPTSVQLAYSGLLWYDPSFSPDGRLVAYTVRELQSSKPHVEVRDLESGKVTVLPVPSRSHPIFISSGVIWYQEEAPGPGLPSSVPTRRTMAFDLETKQETVLPLSTLPADVWPG